MKSERTIHLQRQATNERVWTPRIRKVLKAQLAAFVEAARANSLPVAQAQIGGIIDPAPLREVVKQMALYVGSQEAERFYRVNIKTKAGFGFSIDWLADVEAWLLTFLEPLITRMNRTSIDLILNQINAGLKNGDSYDEIIKEIQSSGWPKVRAAVIARTETNRAMAFGKYASVGKLPYKANLVWIAATDKRTRGADGEDKSDHFRMRGITTPYGVPFIDPRSGANLLFPGDTSLGAKAGDVINCRCTIAARRIK